MIQRILRRLRTSSFWGVVLMLSGLALAVAWLGIGQTNLVCSLSDGLKHDYFGTQATESVTAHRRIRQLILGWQHDDGWRVGESGSKKDVPELLNTRLNEDFDSCFSGHRGMTMKLITNHTVTRGRRDDWKQWWDKHSHQSQAEWMMNGFKLKGIEFNLPPDIPTQIRLLKLIGRDYREQSTRLVQNAPEISLPEYIITNLKRTLLAHDFDASKITPAQLAEDPTGDLWQGVISMSMGQYRHKSMHNPFEESADSEPSSLKIDVFHPATPWIYWLGSFLLFQSGFFLWLRARFERRLMTPQSPEA